VPYNQTIIVTENQSKSPTQSSSTQNSINSAATATNQTQSNSGASMNKTSQGANNVTQGASAALNQTGKALSNVGNNVMQGVKSLVGGGK